MCRAQASELQTLAGKVADVFLKIERCMREEVSTAHHSPSLPRAGRPLTDPPSGPALLQEEKDSSFRSKYGESWDKVGVASASLFQVSMPASKEDLPG